MKAIAQMLRKAQSHLQIIFFRTMPKLTRVDADKIEPSFDLALEALFLEPGHSKAYYHRAENREYIKT